MLIKRLVSLLLTTVIFSTLFAATNAYAAVGVQTQGAVDRLANIGVIDNTNYALIKDKPVTRAQFAGMLTAAMNLQEIADNMKDTSEYSDIRTGTALCGYINILIDKGLMTPTADGKFHPDDPITFAQICTSLIRALGYNDQDLSGPWPKNYIDKAKNIKLVTGIIPKSTDKISLEKLSQMFERLFVTNIKKASDANEVKFSVDTGLLDEYVILADSQISDNIKDNEVLTDKGILTSEDEQANFELGNKYYFKVEDNKIKVVYGTLNKTEYKVVSDIVGDKVFELENMEKKDILLPQSAIYYYQGKKADYETIKDKLSINSSIVFGWNDDSTQVEYVVIFDPVYSKPGVVGRAGVSIPNDSSVIIKNGFRTFSASVRLFDVVYRVTDIRKINEYVLVVSNYAYGNIISVTPTVLSPKSIIVNVTSSTSGSTGKITYQINKDFDVSKLANAENRSLYVILGFDGSVVDIF